MGRQFAEEDVKGGIRWIGNWETLAYRKMGRVKLTVSKSWE